MFEKLVHHVGIHVAKHPKESLAAVVTAGKAVAPFALAAAPYVLGAAAVAGIIYLVTKN